MYVSFRSLLIMAIAVSSWLFLGFIFLDVFQLAIASSNVGFHLSFLVLVLDVVLFELL